MKYIHYILLFSVSALVTAIVGCTQEAKLDGVWRYEAPIAQGEGQLFGGGTVVTERIDLKLSPDGKVDLKWRHGDSVIDSIEGVWKHQEDLLVMTRPDSSFGVFRIVAVEQAELRILTRAGKLYRLTRMPD